jgi:hypothetical protein
VREFVKGLLGGIGLGCGTVLIQEQFTECFIKNGAVSLNLFLGHERVFLASLSISALVVFI